MLCVTISYTRLHATRSLQTTSSEQTRSSNYVVPSPQICIVRKILVYFISLANRWHPSQHSSRLAWSKYSLKHIWVVFNGYDKSGAWPKDALLRVVGHVTFAIRTRADTWPRPSVNILGAWRDKEAKLHSIERMNRVRDMSYDPKWSVQGSCAGF